MTSVTVVLPVYSAGEPLSLAIQSILDQSHRNFEFLIIDDCSKDNSAEIIKKFEKQDSRIRAIYHEKNLGLSSSLNEALALASGDIVLRMDQDDESLPQRLATQVAFLEANPEVVVAGSYVYHMGASTKFDRLVTMPTTHDEISSTLVKYNCMYHPAVALRRKQVLDIGGYRSDFKNAEDYDLWLRVSRTYKIANIPEPLLRYRFSVSGMTLGKKWEQFYFVQLAQVSHQDPQADLAQLTERAKAKLASEDRKIFMGYVYDGTIRELVTLHHWRDALTLAVKCRKELGLKRAFAYVEYILKLWFRSGTARQVQVVGQA